MKKGATTIRARRLADRYIIALRNEKGSYNERNEDSNLLAIIALRNEKGSYNITSRTGFLG